jgi:hypothetical protein
MCEIDTLRNGPAPSEEITRALRSRLWYKVTLLTIRYAAAVLVPLRLGTLGL